MSPLGGDTGLSALNALHSTVGIGGLGGRQQSTHLSGLLGGGTALTGGVSTELAGLCAPQYWLLATEGCRIELAEFQRQLNCSLPFSWILRSSLSRDLSCFAVKT